MKVKLDEKGTLTVTPETGLEQYALERWSTEYFDSCECTGESDACLLIMSF